MNKTTIELTKITIYQVDPANKVRRANISGFQQPLFFGEHGGVKSIYGIDPEVEYPSTFEHIVAATGG